MKKEAVVRTWLYFVYGISIAEISSALVTHSLLGLICGIVTLAIAAVWMGHNDSA